MATKPGDQMVDAGVAGVDQMKIQTAEALEEAAQKLRRADVSMKGEEVKHILHDIEYRLNRIKMDIGEGYDQMEEDYHESVEPFENIIIDHPIPSVLVAAGIGALIGMLIFKARD